MISAFRYEAFSPTQVPTFPCHFGEDIHHVLALEGDQRAENRKHGRIQHWARKLLRSDDFHNPPATEHGST